MKNQNKYTPEYYDKLIFEIKIQDEKEDFLKDESVIITPKDIDKQIDTLVDYVHLDSDEYYWPINATWYFYLKKQSTQEEINDFDYDEDDDILFAISSPVGNNKSYFSGLVADNWKKVLHLITKKDKFEISLLTCLPNDSKVFSFGEINITEFEKFIKTKKIVQYTPTELIQYQIQYKMLESANKFSIVKDDSSNNIYNALKDFEDWIIENPKILKHLHQKAVEYRKQQKQK